MIEIHCRYGYGNSSNLLDIDSNPGKIRMNSDSPYIRFITNKEFGSIWDIENQKVIHCDRFNDNEKSPITENKNGYSISLSDHSDINGTIDYVSKVNPEFLSVDLNRCDQIKGKKLLDYICNELSIKPIVLEIIKNERF